MDSPRERSFRSTAIGYIQGIVTGDKGRAVAAAPRLGAITSDNRIIYNYFYFTNCVSALNAH
jgi:hypothetical protein